MKDKKLNYKIYDDNDKTKNRFDIFVWVSIIAAILFATYAFFWGLLK